MNKNITIILNTHMPYVLGGDRIFDEPENWLFEAITETYIPLINALGAWKPDNTQGKKIIFSLTPCLMEQLSKCKPRYLEYLDIMQKIVFFELERAKNGALYDRYEHHPKHFTSTQLRLIETTAAHYLIRINNAIEFMRSHDLLQEIKRVAIQKPDHIELWTSSPNHNFLPFFNDVSSTHFIRRGIELFEEHFAQKPSGFWLPECAFSPGLEDIFIDAGVRKIAVTPHCIGVHHTDIKSGHYQHKDLELLVHDYRIAMHIWKSELDTLPANPIYREFYRDMGKDVKPQYFTDLGLNLPKAEQGGIWTGLKYFAGTGHQVPLGEKNLYNLESAQQQLREDVPRFIEILDQKRDFTYDRSNFVLAFDTELFGHWWHEGVDWLQHLLNYKINDE
uniref:hypothetical protein n=1 Tax=Cellvibrio fontiphilus TaxID=1815559 RepID=UPI002B4BBC08|nr:hypothetical protein [Cellvibrio fontiphilus]